MLTPFDETLAAAGLFLTDVERNPAGAADGYGGTLLYEGAWGRVYVELRPGLGYVWDSHERVTGIHLESPVCFNRPDLVHAALKRALKP